MTAPVYDVCPYCKRLLDVLEALREGLLTTVFYCPEHGAVPPMRSAVRNWDYVWDGEFEGQP